MRGGAETSGGHITAGHVALGGTGPRGGVGGKEGQSGARTSLGPHFRRTCMIWEKSQEVSYLVLLVTEKLLGRRCSFRGWGIVEGLKGPLLELDPILTYPA